MAKKLSYKDILSMDGEKVWIVDPTGAFKSEYHTVDLKEWKLRAGPNIWECWDIEKEDIDGEEPVCIIYDTKPE